MSSLSEVREVWLEEVFKDSRVQAFTEKVFSYEVVLTSQKEAKKIYHQNEINYIEFSVSSFSEPKIGGALLVTYQVNVVLHRQVDTAGEAYNGCLDLIETIQKVVMEKLSYNWAGVVDNSSPSTTAPEVITTTIDSKNCYRVNYRYTGWKFETI